MRKEEKALFPLHKFGALAAAVDKIHACGQAGNVDFCINCLTVLPFYSASNSMAFIFAFGILFDSDFKPSI